jgi:ribosome-associated heat shock protein Hsp15
VEAIRVDLWLWAVRQFKSRSSANTACRGGHVRINGSIAKPATTVRVGDRVELTVRGVERNIEVVRLIGKRVGAPLAAECLIDHSPPPPTTAVIPPVPTRERGSGRPTKRERRQLDRFRSR